MTPTVEIDTTDIDAAMREMVRLTGLSRKEIMRNEGAAILDRCILWTRMATVAKITGNAAMRARRRVNGDTATMTHGGILWVYSRKSNRHLRAGQFNPQTNIGSVNATHHGRRLGGSLVAAASSALSTARSLTRELTRDSKQARGLAVQSWVQIADSVELPIRGTAKVRTARGARASNGVFYRNGYGDENVSDTAYQIRMVNVLPYNNKIGMAGMFGRAMSGRVKYFENNLRRGVFDSMQTVASRYPGLRAIS